MTAPGAKVAMRTGGRGPGKLLVPLTLVGFLALGFLWSWTAAFVALTIVAAVTFGLLSAFARGETR